MRLKLIKFKLNFRISFRLHRKQRFYLYSRRLPSDLQDVDRDVFNEKPSKEDIIVVQEGQSNFVCILLLFKNRNILSDANLSCRRSKALLIGNVAHNTWRCSYEIICD